MTSGVRITSRQHVAPLPPLVLLDGMCRCMIQSVSPSPSSPVVYPNVLVYMLLDCLVVLSDFLLSIVAASVPSVRRCLLDRSWPSMEDWRTRVLAAEARKAGSASEAARRMPSPPSLTGRDAWHHWVSFRLMFKIEERPLLCVSSYLSSSGCSWLGKYLRVCSTIHTFHG